MQQSVTGTCSIRDSVPIDVRVPLNGICADGGGEVEWGHCTEQSSHGGGGCALEEDMFLEGWMMDGRKV